MARHARQGERAHRARFIVRPLFAALVASGLAAPAALQAATIIVTTGGDAGTGATCTLRQAVESINNAALAGNCQNTGAGFGSGDLVDLTTQAGTITLAGAAEILVSASAVVINGPGAGVLTVSGANASRVFANPLFGPSVALDINNLTVANGLSAGPGGCIFGTGTVRLLNSVVTGCTAQHSVDFPSNPAPFLNGWGGGVAAYDVRLTQSTVSNNTAQTAGGGIFAKYSSTLDHSLVANNTVTGQACDLTNSGSYCLPLFFGGGGMFVGQVQMIHSTVSGNTVRASPLSKYSSGPPPTTTTFNLGMGGGITQLNKYEFDYGSASASAKATVFGARSAEARAARRAAIAASRPKADASGVKRTKADGYADFVLAMQSSTISGNRITGNGLNDGKYLGGGAAARSKYYNAEIANSTISGNLLDPGGEYLVGGGLFIDSAEIFNSTITGNNGIVAVAFKYEPEIMAQAATAKVARSGKFARSAKSARVAAFAAEVRGKLGALRGKRAKAAVNKAASEPIMVSSIVAGNPADYDVGCFEPCTITGSNNLIQNPDFLVNLPLDTITGQNPQLAPLANNGGQVAGAPGHVLTAAVPTHLLFVGSPAINTGFNPEGFEYEQRGVGFPRVVGIAPDIGATEGAIARDIPVPALAPWLVAALSALLGVLGLRRRRRPA